MPECTMYILCPLIVVAVMNMYMHIHVYIHVHVHVCVNQKSNQLLKTTSILCCTGHTHVRTCTCACTLRTWQQANIHLQCVHSYMYDTYNSAYERNNQIHNLKQLLIKALLAGSPVTVFYFIIM